MHVENEINDLNINSTFEEIGSPFSKTWRTHNLRNRKKTATWEASRFALPNA